MGLKCSVLGHKYGDATVERDREEQGSEVVITIREIETCMRCGQERIVSENKEVTSIATPDDPVDTDQDEAAADEGDGEAAATAEVDADVADDSTDDGAIEEDEPAPSTAVTETPVDEDAGVDEDHGAEILDAEADEPVDDELADPSIDESPTDPEPDVGDGEDAVIMGEGDDESDAEGDGRSPGEWPEEPADDADDEWSPSDALEEEPTIKAPDEGTENNTAVTVPEGEFHCGECDYSTPVESSSLRAGDFCPECRTGTLVHRT